MNKNYKLDWYIENSKISNIFVINEKLLKIPSKNYKKTKVNNPFETDNLIKKFSNGTL